MEETRYPIVCRPENLRGEGKPRAWSDELAQANFDWLMSVKESRTEALLSFFGADYPELDSEIDFLESLGSVVARTICTMPNYRIESGVEVLTAPGLSMAFDMGLLVASLIIRSSDGRIAWKILKIRKKELSYNLPVLAGLHSRMYLDPIRGSVTEAKALLNGTKSRSMWADTYNFWLKTLG
jgi:hypothetical protein